MPANKMQVESKIEIVPATNAEQFEQGRRLFREYADGLDVDLCFQSFDEELANVETIYSQPGGALLLAFCDKRIAGCVGVRKLETNVCEMKRLYVKPEYQGCGIGKNLIATIIERARKLEYERMRLDTLPMMERAQKLYAAFGFKKIPAYRYNPDPNTVFMELDLTEMKPEEKRRIIEKYITAYNNFETDEMLSLFARDCTFENYSGEELTTSAKGASELRAMMEEGKNIFAARKQIITELTFQGEIVIAEIDFRGKLKIDLPNGLKASDDLKLKGRSAFEFENGLIKSLKDYG